MGVGSARRDSPGGPRIVVVTGGASGLGEAIANRFATEGDRVVVADADESRGRQVADNLTAAGLAAEAATVDVTSEGEVAAMLDAVAERHGRLDALVCTAIAVNLPGTLLCCKHGLPLLAKSGGGAMVLVGDANAALVSVAEHAAREHGADGVRVNIVSPASNDTGGFEVAATVAFLCSPGAALINGAVIPLARP